jgi:hypothetical protein
MARPSFLYYLFSDRHLPYYVDAAGHVVEGDGNYFQQDGVTPAHLKHSPDGWKENLVHWGRSLKYYGLMRDFTVPLKFVGDGAKIIRNRMWTSGVEAVCHMGIAKLDRTSLPYNYLSWLATELNYVKYIQTKTGVEIEALEGGLSKLIKAFENTVYSIAIDENPDHIEVFTDGMELDYSGKYINVDNPNVGALGPHGSSKYMLPITNITSEGRAPGIAFLTSTLEVLTSGPTTDLSSNTNYFFYTNKALSIRLHGSIKIDFGASHQSLTFRVQDNYGNVLFDANPGLAVTYTGVVDFPFDFTASLGGDTKLFMYAVDALGDTVDYLETEIFIEFVYRHPSSTIKALRLITVLEQLTKLITNNAYTCSSALLTSLTDYCLTSGDALRGIENSVLKISLSDFFKFLFARFSVGLAVHNGQLVIEKLEDFFQAVTIVDLGEVADVTITVAEDLMGNTIKAGYEKQDYTDVNGRNETNQGQQWTTPLTRIIKELDLVSPVRADPVGAELARINFDGKTTTDGTGDNDTFCLNVTGDPAFILNRPAYSSVTGIPHPGSAFNLELTPKIGILNNGKFLHGILDLLDTGVIKMQSADRNKELVTVLGSRTIDEDADIQIGSLDAPLWRPYYFNFKTKIPVNMVELLKANPWGRIKFTYNGNIFFGFLMDGGYKPGTNDSQTWKLLCAPGTNLTLIDNG